MAFRTMSHQPDGPWLTSLADGRCANAVELLVQYCEFASKEFRGRDDETDVVLDVWAATLKALDSDPELLVGKVDWVTKRWLFSQFVEREKIPWIDPWLRAQDLEFHHVDPERNLGLAIAATPAEWTLTPEDIAQATRQAPVNTRAQLRSHIMHQLKHHPVRYFVDWEVIDAEGVNSLNLLNPFEASPDSVAHWCKQLDAVRG
jgi:proteasome accessory factor A